MLAGGKRDRRPWSLVGFVLAGCFERPDPPWLLQDELEILAVRAEVIADGPQAAELIAVPADRARAEALPGDAMRATLLAASNDGIAGEEDLDARWFLCRAPDCIELLREPGTFEPCGAPLLPGSGCSLGSGSEVMFEMPEVVIEPYAEPWVHATLAVVLGTGRPTSECVERLRQQPYPSLSGCSLYDYFIYGGPLWKLAELVNIEFPSELHLQRYVPPTFHPEVERFAVTVRGPAGTRRLVVRTGEAVSVAVGESVRLAIEIDPRDQQQYVLGYEDQIFTTANALQSRYFADVAVPSTTDSWIGAQIDWRVPGDVERVSFVATLTDYHGGAGWGTVAFDVEGAAP